MDQDFQAKIQAKLVEYGYTTEDDQVMSEYIIAMIGNQKTPDRVTAELTDLIGPEYDDSLTRWIFSHPGVSTGTAAEPADKDAKLIGEDAAPTVTEEEPTAVQEESVEEPKTIETVEDSRDTSRGFGPVNAFNKRPQGRGERGRTGVFGAAVSNLNGRNQGTKRDASLLDGPKDSPPHRRRLDLNGIPRGPKEQQVGEPARKTLANGGSPGPVNPAFGPNSLGARMGLRTNNIRQPQRPPQQDDHVQRQIFAVTSQGMPNGQMPMAGGGPQPKFALNPYGQPFVPMQFQHPHPQHMPPFQQQHQFFPAPPHFAQQHFGPGGHPQQYQMHPFMPPHMQGPPMPHRPPAAIPSKPMEDAICRFGVECTNVACKRSHPSPVATKESGLVLSAEACEKQSDCTDPDCSKSHVSPAQKKRRGGKPAEEAKPTSAGVPDAVPSSANPTAPPTASASGPVSTAQVEGTSATASPSSTPAPTASPAQLIPGAGQRPCKFGAACTRPNCVFIHPWQTAGPATVPCKFGSACTRPGCYFVHPPKPTPNYATGGRNMSATFSGPNASIGPAPDQDKSAMSERLKRFADGAKDGEMERIIPGQANGQANAGTPSVIV